MQWGVWLSGLWADAINFVHAWLSDFAGRWSEFTTWFEGMRKNIEPVTWILGSVLALVPGSFAIYKWVYYRYSRLPDRLDDMLEKEERRLLHARQRLLEAIQRPGPTKKFTAPIFVVPSLGKAIQGLKWTSWHRRGQKRLNEADANLAAAMREIESQQEFWNKKRARYSDQKATILLLRGAIAAANGTKARTNGIDGDQYDRIALDYFQQAVAIEPDDHEALEYQGHQQRILGMLDEALASYTRLREIVGNKPGADFAMIYMRAQRYSGEILWAKYLQRPVGARLDQAKACLQDALARMPAIARDELDHAYILRYLCSVEWEKGRQTLWSTHLLSAENIFLNLIRRKKSLKEAEAGLADLQRLRDEIVAAQNDEKSDGDGGPPPDAGAPPNGPH